MVRRKDKFKTKPAKARFRVAKIVDFVVIAGAAACFIVDLFFLLAEGPEPWSVASAFLAAGMVVFAVLLHVMTRDQICWIEIRGAMAELITLRGGVTQIAMAEIVKVVYGMTHYSIHVLRNGEFHVFRCHLQVRVSKNGSWHRGIWIEDFPQARFEDG